MTELILWVQCEYFLLFLANAIITSGNLLSTLSFTLFSQRYFFSSQLSLSLLKRENKSKKLLMILNLGQLPITCFNLECSDLLPILLSLMTLKLLLQIFDPKSFRLGIFDPLLCLGDSLQNQLPLRLSLKEALELWDLLQCVLLQLLVFFWCDRFIILDLLQIVHLRKKSLQLLVDILRQSRVHINYYILFIIF